MKENDPTLVIAPDLPPVILPERYNYIAAFLTMACNLQCSYCINDFGELRKDGKLSGTEWVRGLNRLRSRPDLPITLQGGEPTLHPDFYEIVNGVRDDLNIALLTNLQVDVREFMANISPGRMKREAPYASIRVSYHPETMPLLPLLEKVETLLTNGYSVGIWALEHPDQADDVAAAARACRERGIDFRTKALLGMHERRLHGEYRYADAIGQQTGKRVMCRTSECIVGPTGSVYRCHSDAYARLSEIGHICDETFALEDAFRPCDRYGFCNPCDVKIKTNRYQEFGHTSVEIRSAHEV